MADEVKEKEGIPWKELLVDKSIDAILIPVGLFAALWFQGWVDENKEREDYVGFVSDFHAEVVANREKVKALEKDIGLIGDIEAENVLGPLQTQFDQMKDDSEDLSAFFDCADSVFELAAKAPGLLLGPAAEPPAPPAEPPATPSPPEPPPTPVADPAVAPTPPDKADELPGIEKLDEDELAELNRCLAVFEEQDKKEPKRFVGVDLSPFYGYVVWTVYLQDGIKLFKDPEAKKLGLTLGQAYAAQREVEQRLDEIETLFNESLMKTSGQLAALVAESDDMVPDDPTPDDLKSVQDRIREMSQEAYDLRYVIENSRNVLALKVTRLKLYLTTTNGQLDTAIQALEAERARLGVTK